MRPIYLSTRDVADILGYTVRMVDAPFLSFYTPTYRRPQRLAACLESVRVQTVHCEQVVIVDHVGIGIAGMYATVARYASALHGQYVHFLADDDTLAGPHVVAQVREFAIAHDSPDVIIVRAIKNGLLLPRVMEGPPVQGEIDLGCFIVRLDVWQAHANDYGRRYEGDADFGAALWAAGRRFAYCDVLFEVGPALHGQPEWTPGPPDPGLD